MSWDAKFYMPLKNNDGYPIDGYLQVLERLRSIPELFSLQSVSIHESSLDPRYKIAKFENSVQLRIDDVAGFVRQYSRKADIQNLLVLSEFWVPRSITSYPEGEDIECVEDGLREAFMILRGQLATWNPVSERRDLNLVWEVGNAFEYSRRQPEVKWKQNMRSAMAEIEAFISTGCVSEVWGAGPNFDGTSKEAFLLYMRQKKDLLRELLGSTNPDLESRFESALQQLKHLVDVKAVSTGLLVSAQDFFGETLAEFRAALAESLLNGCA